MRNIILLLIIYFTFSFAKDKVTTITILFFNDFHGRIFPEIVKEIDDNIPVGGAAYISQLVNEERKKNPTGCLFVASGDMFHGTPYSNLLKGKSVVKIMNYMRLDAMGIGNHEFDWGEEVLAQLVSLSKFTYLSANIFSKDGKRPSYLKPYLIVERKGKKIALIGVITKESPSIIHPDYIKNLTFKNPQEILPSIIKEVKEKGADLIVLLSHLGFEEDKKIAEKVEGIHVIIGAHSHTVLMSPYLTKNVIITHAGYHGIYLGVLELKIDDSTNEIVDYSKDSILKVVYAGEANRIDKKIAKILDRYYPPSFTEELLKEIGKSEVDLIRKYKEESNIGNLICDAMRELSGADIAFYNSGGIRIDITKGTINKKLIHLLLPFDNFLVLMELSGTQILKILEESAFLEKGILQVSGLKVKYNLKRSKGERVIEAFIGETQLDHKKIYKVATSDFLAAGGDNFLIFKEGKSLQCEKKLVRDILTEYIKKNSSISPRVEGRIIIEK